jgi:hypothetical protein
VTSGLAVFHGAGSARAARRARRLRKAGPR